jgi:hypothetical protein
VNAIGKSVFIDLRPDLVMENLMRPIFWARPPISIRRIALDQLRFSIGAEIRPGFITYRLAECSPDALVFTTDKGRLRFTATPLDGGTALRAEIPVNGQATSEEKGLMNDADILLKGIAEAYSAEPELAWLTVMDVRVEEIEARSRIEMVVDAALELAASVEELEEVLVRQPENYARWLDCDIARGEFTVDAGWPAHNARVQYRYPMQMWWLMPWMGRENKGEIELVSWVPGSRLVLRENSTVGRVTTTSDFTYSKQDNGTILWLKTTAIVRSFAARKLMGRFVRNAIPAETTGGLCGLAALVAGHAATRQRQAA